MPIGTIPLHRSLLGEACTAARVLDVWSAHYAAWPKVEVMHASLQAAAAMRLDPQALNDTDRLRLMVFGDAKGEHLLLAAVLDNLGKGAAGAAVQNLELLLGRA